MNTQVPNVFIKSMLLSSMLFLFCAALATAQKTNLQRSHAINTSSSLEANVPDTLTILATRVAFQPDDNRLTTGNGTFSSGSLPFLENNSITIDPLPHDSAYFAHHLEFAKNYFETVSGGQLTVQYRILPNTYQLPKQMQAYSPTGQTFTNEKVAALARDTWQIIEQQGGFSTNGLDPKKTAFVIFHAGVGRDIELIATNLTKTPQDIPSLFLGKNSLAKLLNQPNFDGFDINDGAFNVTNSLILPRTLSRPGENVSGEQFVLQLSINGLLTASIGSYLGLPDLFNTQSGNSGIGRFGLMDGESFFSYRGLFPPEPSAWEKIFLGWQTPFSISKSNNSLISLPHSSAHQPGSIAKYDLSSQEYFLIENRHRDPNTNGVEVQFAQPDASTTTKQFSNTDEAFVNQTNEFLDILEPGVVTDVSNFDWSLPGGLDVGSDEEAGTADDRYLNGGILIWHIDEGVIRRELGTQTVNTNQQRRGVDLEEADGAQDIGRAATNDFSQQARGTAFDFWWDGNNASVVTLDNDTLSFYENRFGPDTRPSNQSNSGAQSFFELYDFSDNQPTASFRIQPAKSQNISPLPLPVNSLPEQSSYTLPTDPYYAAYPLGLALHKSASDSFLVIPTQTTTYALNLGNDSNPLYDFQMGASQQPYTGQSLILGAKPVQSQIALRSWQWSGNSWLNSWNSQVNANNAFISSVNVQQLLLDFTDQKVDIINGSVQQTLSDSQQRSATLDGQYTTLSPSSLTLQPKNIARSISSTDNRQYTGAVQLTDNRPGFYYLSDDNLLVFDAKKFNKPKTIVRDTPLGWPAMTDINNDGRIDFIYVNKRENTLEARNINGALLPKFPIEPPVGATFSGTPLIATSSNSKQPLLMVPTQDSLSMNISAYRTNGRVADGFPLFVGSAQSADSEAVHPILKGKKLYAVSHKGELKAWTLEYIDQVRWASRYGNNPNNKVSGNLQLPNGQMPAPKQDLLVKEETYNWPNPAENFTNIRFETGRPGTVDIKIITSGGKVVFTERYASNAGTPEEYRISTRGWSSGLYFGMVTAKANGEQSRKMIKIVVVK
jgi:hypothetical protein